MEPSRPLGYEQLSSAQRRTVDEHRAHRAPAACFLGERGADGAVRVAFLSATHAVDLLVEVDGAVHECRTDVVAWQVVSQRAREQR
ncbi:hypothetical protein [Kineococcus sp. SYSU DK005]|uniref:hypothetical protein n=1 Tax=Kineococcus sp. SYSU DK005 TaxID=3383126 RepID=UPI003D7DA925